MPASLNFHAGPIALARLRREGWNPEAFRVMAGAAGGPKFLVLGACDRLLFTELFAGRRTPLHLLGSSIGSWRFAAASRRDPTAAFDRLEEAYITQSYEARPSPRDVSAVSRRVLGAVIDDHGAAEEILSHPTQRLSIVTVRGRGLAGSERPWALGLGLGGAMLGNALHARALHGFFRRTLFHDPRDRPPFLGAPGYGADVVPLRPENLGGALLASGSIPWVMAGVSGIPGAPAGVYRDGGVMDYHMNVPFLGPQAEDLVLFPHFGPRVVPGWFDKSLPWRKASAAFFAHVLMVTPSPEFLASLPHGKIPDRKDFTVFAGRDRERMTYWRAVVAASRRLADEFHELIAQGRLADVIQPFPPRP